MNLLCHICNIELILMPPTTGGFYHWYCEMPGYHIFLAYDKNNELYSYSFKINYNEKMFEVIGTSLRPTTTLSMIKSTDWINTALYAEEDLFRILKLDKFIPLEIIDNLPATKLITQRLLNLIAFS